MLIPLANKTPKTRQEKTLTTWDLRMADPVRIIDLDEEVAMVSEGAVDMSVFFGSMIGNFNYISTGFHGVVL